MTSGEPGCQGATIASMSCAATASKYSRATAAASRGSLLIASIEPGYPWRSCARLILPLLVFGSSATNSTTRGNL
jgi:hypothetical protein